MKLDLKVHLHLPTTTHNLTTKGGQVYNVSCSTCLLYSIVWTCYFLTYQTIYFHNPHLCLIPLQSNKVQGYFPSGLSTLNGGGIHLRRWLSPKETRQQNTRMYLWTWRGMSCLFFFISQKYHHCTQYQQTMG